MTDNIIKNKDSIIMEAIIMLSQHAALSPLIKYYISALSISLKSMLKNHKKTNLSALEYYSFNIFNRIREIENSLEKIELALEYLNKSQYLDSNFKYTSHYSYHVERLIIEIYSINDRCWLLIGTSLLLKNNKIEKIGSRKTIKKEIYGFNEIECCIEKIEELISPYKKIRNNIAHNKSYCNEYLTYLIQQESGNINNEIEDIINNANFKKLLKKETTQEFNEMHNLLGKSINNLIESLSPLYLAVISN